MNEARRKSNVLSHCQKLCVCVCVVCLRVAVWGCWKVCIRMSLSQLLYTINTFSIVLSAMSTYSQCFSPYSTSQLLMVTLSGILCFHSLLSALKVNFRAAHTYKCILDTKKSLHSPVSLVIYVSVLNRSWIEPFLFVLSVWPSSPMLPSLSHLCPALHFAVFTCDVSHQTLLHPPLCSSLQCQSTIIPAVFFPQDAQGADSFLWSFLRRKHFESACALLSHALFLIFSSWTLCP